MAGIIEMEMSKTYQYRKVMKPMLERKRRARINKCLDELKDLMVATLESEGEHVTRLEKADILELTVSHLQKLRQQRKLNGNLNSTTSHLSQAEGFRSGFIFAANEVSRNLAKIPGVNVSFGTQLMTHLGQRLNQIQPSVIKTPIPVNHPITVQCGSGVNNSNNNGNGYINNSGLTYAAGCSSSLSPRSIYSVPMSPISNYSESPQPVVTSNDGLLLKQTNLNRVFNLQQQPDENVWRPW